MQRKVHLQCIAALNPELPYPSIVQWCDDYNSSPVLPGQKSYNTNEHFLFFKYTERIRFMCQLVRIKVRTYRLAHGQQSGRYHYISKGKSYQFVHPRQLQDSVFRGRDVPWSRDSLLPKLFTTTYSV